MHELGIVFHIIDSIEEVGRQNKLRRVSTVFPLSHKSSVTSPPSLNTGKFRPIRFSGYSDSSFL